MVSGLLFYKIVVVIYNDELKQKEACEKQLMNSYFVFVNQLQVRGPASYSTTERQITFGPSGQSSSSGHEILLDKQNL